MELHNLGEELRDHHEELAERWFRAWRQSSHPHLDVSPKALKNSLASQLQLVGEQLRDLSRAEEPERLWDRAERLDPEKRVEQRIPVEDVVQEYALAIEVVRSWIEERGIEVPFSEYSYFYRAMFELSAESVRRYAAHEAERTRKDRAHYLASVMHQLRTPLFALSMQVDSLQESGERADPAVLSLFRRNVNRIAGLVDGILRLERFEVWEVPLSPTELCPAELIEGIVSDNLPQASRKGVRLEALVSGALSMVVDPALFVDALGNLVHNAVKYTSHGFVVVEAVEQAREVVFQVRDSGPGIEMSTLRTLFRQAQPGSATGSGIGLQIAQHAAQAQGGAIEVESQVGRGTTFSLHLPRVVTASGRRAGLEPALR